MRDPDHVDIAIYTDQTGAVEVRLQQDTVWLTQRQMADLLQTSVDNIGLHLRNIYAESELSEEATTEDFSVVRQEGKRRVQRRLMHYNLDAVISVGYRVSSEGHTFPSVGHRHTSPASHPGLHPQPTTPARQRPRTAGRPEPDPPSATDQEPDSG